MEMSEFDKYVADIVRQVAAETATTQTPQNQQGNGNLGAPANTPPNASPIVVNLGGQAYQFADNQQLSAALEKTFADYQTKLLEAQNANLRTGDRAGSFVGAGAAEPAGPQFSNDRYIELMAKNPIDAQEYLDSFRYFDGKVEKPSELIRQQLVDAAVTQQELAAYKFKDAHSDFPADPRAALALDNIRRELNLPFNVQGLEAAYALGQSRGVFAPSQQFQQQQQQPGQQPQQVQQQQYQQFSQQHPDPRMMNQMPPQFSQNVGPGQIDPRAWNGGAMNQNFVMGPPPSSMQRNGYEPPPDMAAMAENMTPEQIEAVFAKIRR